MAAASRVQKIIIIFLDELKCVSHSLQPELHVSKIVKESFDVCFLFCGVGMGAGGWVVQRGHVSYVTGASN